MRNTRAIGNGRLNRKLRFEGLETCAMLTGTVTATNVGGVLTISGDDAANVIVVQGAAVNAGLGVLSVQIQGFGTKINNLDTGTTSNSATFTGVADIDVALNGGGDVMTMKNLNIPDTLSIDMGSGNDVLIMNNVHELLDTGPVTATIVHGNTLRPALKPHISGDASITLGSGIDVAVLHNVTSAGDINIDAGDGIDVVTLIGVSAGTSGSGNTLSVDMGTGRSNVLTVISSTADFANFTSEGSFGLLNFKHLGNHFGSETNSGFTVVV